MHRLSSWFYTCVKQSRTASFQPLMREQNINGENLRIQPSFNLHSVQRRPMRRKGNRQRMLERYYEKRLDYSSFSRRAPVLSAIELIILQETCYLLAFQVYSADIFQSCLKTLKTPSNYSACRSRGGVLNSPRFCLFLFFFNFFFRCQKLMQRSCVIPLGTSRMSRPKHGV